MGAEDEVKELEEHAEEGASKAMRPVALTMSILAVIVAVITMLGERSHTAAVIYQTKAAVEQNVVSDTWGEYQAKKIRSYETGLASDSLSVVALADKKAAKSKTEGYNKHQEKWNDDLKEIEAKAHENEQQVHEYEEQVEKVELFSNRYNLAQVLLEIALVVTSITLLTHVRIYWFIGLVFAAGGIASALSVLLLK